MLIIWKLAFDPEYPDDLDIQPFISLQ